MGWGGGGCGSGVGWGWLCFVGGGSIAPQDIKNVIRLLRIDEKVGNHCYFPYETSAESFI